MDLHDLIYASNKYNFKGLRIPVPTKLHIGIWRQRLLSYNDRQLCEFLEFGWPVGYTKDALPVTNLHNHKSAIDYYEHVDNFIETEVNLGATAGPFASNPLKTLLAISPLLTVSKRDTCVRRIVLDLDSSPFVSG